MTVIGMTTASQRQARDGTVCRGQPDQRERIPPRHRQLLPAPERRQEQRDHEVREEINEKRRTQDTRRRASEGVRRLFVSEVLQGREKLRLDSHHPIILVSSPPETEPELFTKLL